MCIISKIIIRLGYIMNTIKHVTLSDGTQEYRLDGELHREDGPARIFSNGTEHWRLNGKLHREDGPAISMPDGAKMWYVNGLEHRIGGPAILHPNGENMWYVNGLQHRIDGPASIEYDIDAIMFTWYLDGEEYDLADWLEKTPITDEQKTQIVLNYKFLEDGDEYSDRFIIEYGIDFDYWLSEVYLELTSSELNNLRDHYRIMNEDE